MNTSVFSNCPDLNTVCVPADYKESWFCGAIVTSESPICQQFKNMFDNCSKGTFIDGKVEAEKSIEVIEWEERSNECMEYACDSMHGLVSWKMCNSSNDARLVCVNGSECVESQIMNERSYSVEMEVEDMKIEDFNEALKLANDDHSWYLKEISLYTHHNLDKPISEWDLESFYPTFKEGCCKNTIPATLLRYKEQQGIDESIPDVKETDLPSEQVINKVIVPAMNIGKHMQYYSQGFIHNKSQYLRYIGLFVY